MMRILFLFAMLCIGNHLTAQIELPKWEFGRGLRLNYLGLSGGYSGERYSDGYTFNVNYNEIGMDNYAPSMAIH